MLLIQLLPSGTLVHAARRLVATTRPYLEGHWLVNLTSTIFSLPSPEAYARSGTVREHPLDKLVLHQNQATSAPTSARI
jgi:hypothetical protein